MAPLSLDAVAGPKVVYLVDSFAQGAHANARVGDFMGIVGTADTFVRGPDAWHPTSRHEVQRSFDATGCIGLHKHPCPPPPAYSPPGPNAPTAALTWSKATL